MKTAVGNHGGFCIALFFFYSLEIDKIYGILYLLINEAVIILLTPKHILAEIHLYDSKMEYLVKYIIWLISWGGGVFVLRNAQDGIASAYLLFSLSLLTEFSSHINKTTVWISKVPHTIFCTPMIGILFFSFTSLLSASCPATTHNIMFYFSCFIMLYITIDFILLWCFGDNTPPILSQTSRPSTTNPADLFNDNLASGGLGTISEVNSNV